MKVTYRWLQEHVPLDRGPEDVAEGFTMRGFAVDALVRQSDLYRGIVVAEVLSVAPLAGGGALSVCEVTDGAATLRVVCGAPNVRPGGLYPLAVPGSLLPGGRPVETAEIRGVPSQGMLCSGRELRLSADASELLELEALAPGRPLAEALDLDDVVYEIDVGYNRPDCLSVFGLAREISALIGRPLRDPRTGPREPGPPIEAQLAVEIEDLADCPRYGARVLTKVGVGPSPEWLARRLFLVGQRPLNNVVDATNYTLLTYGQPIHAFDLRALRGARLCVRRGREGERLRTLDGVERAPGPGTLVIADAERAVAIAGIMGGEETEVTEATREVALESAHFAPPLVQLGRRRLGLFTEASMRFERGIDPEGVIPSLDFVAGLIAELTGGWVSAGRMERGRGSEEPVRLAFDPAAPARLTGAEITAAEARVCLEKLGFEWKTDERRALVEVPAWRGDIHREVDLVEEVARSYGYDKIPERQWNGSGLMATRGAWERLASALRQALTGFGWDEAVTPSLASPEEAALSEWLDEDDPTWQVTNPPSRELSCLRRSALLPLLRAVAHNRNRGTGDVRLFEIGKIFSRRPAPLGSERWMLAGAATGAGRPPHWSEPAGALDLYDVKGVLEGVIGILRIDSHEVRCYHGPGFERSAALEYLHRGSRFALAGQVDPVWAGRFGIDAPVFGFVADGVRLEQALGERPVFREPSRFPSVRRDLAFIVPETVAHETVAAAVRASGGEWVTQVRLFDLYRGEKLGAGRKSLAYALTFQSQRRTLTDAEVDAAVEAVIRHVTGTLGATHRAF